MQWATILVHNETFTKLYIHMNYFMWQREKERDDTNLTLVWMRDKSPLVKATNSSVNQGNSMEHGCPRDIFLIMVTHIIVETACAYN